MDSPKTAELLAAWQAGDHRALDALMPVVYEELRRLAGSYLRRERGDHTLQTTALVHEAYLRLIGQREVAWKSRAQLLGLAAQMMRRILVNHARDRQASKRGGGVIQKVSIDEARDLAHTKQVDVLALNDALNELEALDERQSRIVELRYFGGLNIEETAAALDISAATVKREWTTAKLWLHDAVTQGTSRDD